MSSSAISGPIVSDNKRAPAGTAAAPSFAFNDSTGTGVYLVSPGVLGLSTAGVQRVVVDSAGNVGIGTASPGAALEIIRNTTSGGGSDYPNIRLNNQNAAGYSGFYFYHGLVLKAGLEMKNDVGALVFATGSSTTERFSIHADGVKFFVNGYIAVSSSAIGPGAGTYPVKWNASSGILTYDSSSRLVKDQIEDIPYGLASVLSLQPRKYFRTDDQKEEIGFIADEVQSIIPEVVPMVEKKVFTKDEQDTELIPGGVNYDKLTAVLVKAIQELEARLAALEAK